MKKIYFICILLLSILTTTFLYLNTGTQKYNSSYGFTTEVSKNWFVATKDAINNEGSNFNKDSKNVSEKLLPYIEKVKDYVLKGYGEYLYYKKSDSDFQDNMSVLKIQSSKVDLKKRIKELCSILEEGVEKTLEIEIDTKYCTLKNVFGIDTMTYSYNDLTNNTTNIRYQFNTNKESIILNINCKENKCEKIKIDAENMIKNLKLD